MKRYPYMKMATLNTVLLFSFFMAFVSGCGDKQKSSTPKDSKLFGLASPIQLDWGSNTVLLNDYFPDDLLIDSIRIDGPLTFGLDEATGMLLTIHCATQELPRLMNMTVFAEGIPYGILLKAPTTREVVFRYPENQLVHNVEFKASFTNWALHPFERDSNDAGWVYKAFVAPGNHEYKFVVNGVEINDPGNPDSMSNGMGGYNSILHVTDLPEGANPIGRTPHLYPSKLEGKTIQIMGSNVKELIAYWNNFRLECVQEGPNWVVRIPPFAKDFNRSHIRVYGYGDLGVANDLLIPLAKDKVITNPSKLTSNDWQSSIMYFMMVDRFVDGDSSNNAPLDDPRVHPKANYYGGDLAGITQKIESGYFRELGINTIWISPIAQNPLDAWGQFRDPDIKYSGYHGYWPISSSQVDHRFGTSDELKHLLDVAHKHGFSVLLDYVANHVHKQHPVYQQHPDWVTDLYLPDGSLNTERWDDHRLTTWFDTFMPSLNLMDPNVAKFMADSAAFWIEQYDFDGFRHDATKHIPENFWRLLTKRVKQRAQERGQYLYQIGETYGSRELINSYISTGMLDGQFDFNLYDNALAVFANDQESWKRLTESLKGSLNTYGEHHLMGNITGNQDKPRFISFADGSMSFDTEWMEYKRMGLKKTIPIGDPVGYKKLALFHAFNMTIPGIPIVYYGDEIGLPGAGDPDNRRMMRFDGLSDDELALRKAVSNLSALRQKHMALMYGDFELISADQALVYKRTYFGDEVVVILNRQPNAIDITVPGEGTHHIEAHSYTIIEHTPTNE
ncbi:MAG: alpha-amylase [Bacteroidetes bacterium]|nr:alpha-amylase [Bacteroidota bacterium]